MPKPLPPTTIEALNPPAKNYTFFENVAEHPFQPNDTALNLRNAWWLMDAALLSYSSVADVDRHFSAAGLGATIEHFDGQPSTQAYVASSADWIVLAFRGTQVDDFWSSVIDWGVDAQFFPVLDSHFNLVHAGFLAAIREVWRDLAAHVAGLQNQQTRPFWIVGHSLGAALATVAANLCSDQPKHLGLKGLYTFGSPRVGDATFGARIPCTVRRFRNNSDLVTHVPLGLVFRHVGELELIDAAGHAHLAISGTDKLFLETMTVHLSPAEAHTMSRLLQMSGGRAPLPGFIADHAPINYAIRTWNCYEAGLVNSPPSVVRT
jgi:triacylglycerol lipase